LTWGFSFGFCEASTTMRTGTSRISPGKLWCGSFQILICKVEP
jgi:hypothetical protein